MFVFLKLPPAACTIPGYNNYNHIYGNKHKNHSRQTLHDTFTTVTAIWKPGLTIQLNAVRATEFNVL